MHVVCSNCGEELLGAVNCCWQCGQKVISTPDAATAPPLRQRPVESPLEQPPDLIIAETADDNDDVVIYIADAVGGELKLKSEPESEPQSPRTGPGNTDETPAHAAAGKSPATTPTGETTDSAPPKAAEGEAAQAPPVEKLPRLGDPLGGDAPRPANYQQVTWRELLSIISIGIGLLSILGGIFSAWLVPLAALGLLLAFVGLTSRWRLVAALAVLVCFIGLAASGGRVVYGVYSWWQGGVIDQPVEPPELPESLD